VDIFNQYSSLQEFIDSTKEGNGRTIIHFISARNNLEIFKYLCSLKVDYTICDSEGNSALFIAAQNKALSIVKYLIQEKHQDLRQ